MVIDVIKKHFNLSFENIGNELRAQYSIMVDELMLKGIKYQNLKNILTPQKDKKDICLVFDTSFIKESWYGNTIFKKYFPLIADFSGHCIFEGDLIGSNENQTAIRHEMMKRIKIMNQTTYKNSCFYFLVYINNLTDKKLNTIINGLKPYKEFTGYFDFTYSCLLKEYISNIIGQRYFIYEKNIVISSSEYDISEENMNMVGYDFDKYGFHVKSISDMNYNIFLTYKIERKYFDIDISDQLYSLSAINNNVDFLRNFKINIEDEKLNYLLAKKAGSMKTSKLWNMDKAMIEKLLLSKIDNDYIFNLEINEHNIVKFATIIENSEIPSKLLLALEYLPEIKELRLITMY
jgi:hypothetical protein